METLTGGLSVIVVVVDFVGSATLVVVTVTCCGVVTEAGAVYLAVSGPVLVRVPRLVGLIDQVADWLERILT
jgi:hypothetical protein